MANIDINDAPNPKATKEYIIPDIKPFKTVSIKFSNSTLMN